MQRHRADSASSDPTPLVPAGEQPSHPSRAVFVTYATCGISVLSTSNQNPELRFHAFQAVFFVLSALAVHAVIALFGGFLAPFRPIYDLVAVGGYGYLLWAAWQQKPVTIPILSAFARKQATPSARGNDTVQ